LATLRQLLEIRAAYARDFSDDASQVLVSSNVPGTLQLYLAGRDGAGLSQLTDLPEPVTGQFVAGTGRILVEMDEGGNERIQLYLMDARAGADLEPFVHDPDHIHRAPHLTRDGSLVAYSSNARTFVDFDVCVKPLEGGDERILFAEGGWCEAAGFSPDGRWLAVQRLTERSGDNDLYLVDVESGERVFVSPHDDEALFGAPAWLGDSSGFFFATSTGREFADVARYDMATRSWEIVLESEWDKECRADPSGRHLLVDENADGYSRLELRDPVTLESRGEVPLPGRGVAVEPVFSRDGRYLAYHFTSPLEPGDVWVYDTDSCETTRATQSPREVSADDFREPALHRFDSFDGESIPVFVYEADDSAPVVAMIHGGPEGQLRPVFNPLAEYFAQNGYAVVGPNVRGSTGYGKRFEHLDDVYKRLDSVRDLVSLHDWLGEQDRFDTDRVVLFGGSYGGYMVLAGLAFHPDRWTAGIDIVGLSSLVTFLENTSEWRRAFREREYGSLERDREFLESVSPMTHVDQIRAPLFIIHGRNDPRVPVTEAEQLYAVLSAKGIPCELVIYDDEGHGLAKLANRLDAYPRAIAFLERVLSMSRAETRT
jgi:dipeptidyl aminopeptidase/acylaminoacyl peptidase